MSENENLECVEPVRVHLSGSDIPLIDHPDPNPRRRGLSVRSFILTTNDPVQQILPLNVRRCQAWVQPATNPITIATSKANALAGGTAVGTIPATNTGPFPLHTTDEVWATAASLPTTVTVIAIIEGP